jgi:hypothetical protein
MEERPAGSTRAGDHENLSRRDIVTGISEERGIRKG